MQTLKIPVEQLREGPLELDLDMDSRELELEDEKYRFTGRVHGTLAFTGVGLDVVAVGEVAVPVVGRCGRCREPAGAPLRGPVNETWIAVRGGGEPGASDLEAIVNTYVGDVVESAGVLRELIMAALPDRLYCREDCRGLCRVAARTLTTSRVAARPSAARNQGPRPPPTGRAAQGSEPAS